MNGYYGYNGRGYISETQMRYCLGNGAYVRNITILEYGCTPEEERKTIDVKNKGQWRNAIPV